MATLNSLMKHLRGNGIAIGGSAEKRVLKNIGYYHGYKGYRFTADSNERLPIDSFSQVVALNKFDSELKALLYPKIMQLETALKNYTIEAMVIDSGSEQLEDVWSKTVTGYRSIPKGKKYKEACERRLRLRREIDDLVYSRRDKPVIKHFWTSDRDIPIWALCEVMTLGCFGNLYACLSPKARSAVAMDLGFPTNIDSSRILTAAIFALKDLRNAVAHNGVIFDVRFRSGSISKELSKLLEGQMGIKSIDFRSITDYVLLVVFLMRGIKCSITERRRFIRDYVEIVEEFRGSVPYSIFARVIPTNHRSKVKAAVEYEKARNHVMKATSQC